MRYILFMMCLIAAVLTAGCSFLNPAYREPEVFDLPPAVLREDGEKLPECVIGTIRNFSGADRRFLFRGEAGRMEADEYSRWLLTPDLKLERQLMSILDDRPSESGLQNYLQLNAVIRRFEFDPAAKQALFEVEFTVRVFRDKLIKRSVSKSVRCTAPVKENSSAGYAAAMTQCIHEAALAARKLLETTNVYQ